MKKPHPFKMLVCIAMGILAITPHVKAETGTRSYTQSVAYTPNKPMVINTHTADVEIVSEKRKDIVAEAQVEFRNGGSEHIQTLLDQTKLILESDKDGVQLKLEWPPKDPSEDGRNAVSRSAKVRIHLPLKQYYYAKNRFGDIQASGAQNGLRIVNQNGEVDVQDCGGTMRLTNRFGPVRATQIQGDLIIDNSNGRVTVNNINGNATIENAFEAVNVQTVTGNLIIDAGNSRVTAQDIQGDCTIASSFETITTNHVKGHLIIDGQNSAVTANHILKSATIESSFERIHAEHIGGPVSIRGQNCAVTIAHVKQSTEIQSSFERIQVDHIQGDLTIRGQNCAVTVANISQNVDIRSSFETIEAKHIGGTLKVKGPNCRVSALNIQNDVNITNSFDSVSIKQSSASIDVKGRNSAITVSEIKTLPPDAHITLKTSFEPINLYLSENTDAQVFVYTGHNKIKTDFPVLVDSKMPDETFIKLGNGAAKIRLETNEKIRVKKE